jgi:hypothetical protein
MADVNIVITGASLAPNPVNTGASCIISVEVLNKVYVLDSGDGNILADSDGTLIETE